jgi:hypothetical protein
MWLSNKVYPRVVDFDIAKEARDFYMKVYDFNVPQEDLRNIIGG